MKRKPKSPKSSDFHKATEVWVSHPEHYKALPHFYSIDCYGPSFEVDSGEFGMLFIKGKVSLRLFH
jgi:hypothetical protein